MAKEKRAASPLKVEQPEFQSDTTGNVKVEGTRHIMQEEMEAAGDGVFGDVQRVPAPENKQRKAAPEEGAPVSADTAPAPTPKRTAARKRK